MKNIVRSNLLIVFASMMAITSIGCSAGSSGVASSPVFPPSTLDYSSQLEQLQARQGGSRYVPPGGFDDAPSRGPLFSSIPRRSSGSC